MNRLRHALLLAAVVLQAGCGLPDSYFLQAPVVTLQASGTTNFQFSNPIHGLTGTLDVNVAFIGNELYYRFYANPATININAYDPTNPSDPSTQLQNAGFLPVRSSTDLTNSPSIPLISIQSLGASGSIVTVAVVNGSPSTPTSTYSVSGGGPTGEIRRNVADPNNLNYFKSFATNAYTSPTNYSPSDADMSDGSVQALIGGGSNVYVAIYALSYGMSVSSTPIRSTPTYLGFMQILQF